MKYKKIILGVALALACFSSLNANALTETKVKKTETQAAAPNVYWTDGYGRVSYTTNSIISPVVKIALKEFAGDMKAVTRIRCERKIRCSDTDLPARPAHQQGVFGSRKTRCAAASYYHRKGCFLHRYEERETHRYRKQRPRNGLRHHETL